MEWRGHATNDTATAWRSTASRRHCIDRHRRRKATDFI
nr:MAG TPA: hypothetical protein [Caudoviricetes sp.]